MDRKIGIIIVSYHNPKGTERYLKKELTKLSFPYTLIVVDVDASPESSKKLAESCGLFYLEENNTAASIPRTNKYLISCRKNLGYARGNNLGVKFLNKCGNFTHYLFSNDDIEIKDPNTLTKLAEKLDADSSLGCIGPRIIGLDGHDQSPHMRYISPYRMIGWNILPFLRTKKGRVNILQQKPSNSICYWVCGAFMMVKADYFLQAGMFDDSTFLYFEEVILAERLLQINKKVYFLADVEVLHYEGGSSSNINLRKQQFLIDSQVLYYKKYKHVSSFIIHLYKLSFIIHNLFNKKIRNKA